MFDWQKEIMLLTFVYRADDISALSRSSLDSAEKPAVRYTNVNGIVVEENHHW